MANKKLVCENCGSDKLEVTRTILCDSIVIYKCKQCKHETKVEEVKEWNIKV